MILKFRVWHRELGRLMSVKCMFFQDSEIEEFELNDALMNDYITAYPDEIELMQSTGLQDKNGKEIFEGDVVRYNIDVVDIKKHPTLGFYTVLNGREGFFGDGMIIEDFEKDAEEFSQIVEIIGNVYKNPELLEEKE
ncbi:YopX family protein [Streptococcus mitis]|uniref:YopX family protein n=1 Tax=Streptococcus mitis TaxID=28037 RepID=UPI0021B72987|nr:YopX family protein [Streptococcus mitis]